MGPCQHSDMTDRAGESVVTGRGLAPSIQEDRTERRRRRFWPFRHPCEGSPASESDVGRLRAILGAPVAPCAGLHGLGWVPAGPLFRASPAPDPRRVPPDPVPAPRLVIPVTCARRDRSPMSMSEGGMSLRSAREGAKGRRRRRGRGRCGAVGGLRPESGDGRRVGGWPGRWGHPPPPGGRRDFRSPAARAAGVPAADMDCRNSRDGS